MSSVLGTFEQVLPNYRLVQINHGDTLQDIAARYLGDANQWIDLAQINNLVWPYVTDDPELVGPRVLLSGNTIKVPAAVGTQIGTSAGDTFLRDIAMKGKRMQVDASGDFALVSGAANLKQQLADRVMTPMGQLSRHPDYGCMAYRLIGKANGPTADSLASQYVRTALAADYRVSSVQSSKAAVSGEAIAATAQVMAIDGNSFDMTWPSSQN